EAYKSSVKIELKLKNPDYDRILNLLEKAKVDYPDDAEIWFLLGKVYVIKHRPKDMLEAFAQANKLSPKEKDKGDMKKMVDSTWVACFNRGLEYANRVPKIEKYAEESFSNWSNYPIYADTLQMLSSEFTSSNYNWKDCISNADLAILLEKLKQDLYTKSLEHYELSALIDSTRYEAFINAAFVATKLGQLEKTLSYSKKAYELKPDQLEVLNNYFAVLLNNKKYEEALKISKEILEKNPNDLNALFNQAVILENLGREQETMELYNKIIAQDPNSKDVYFNRALLFLNKTSQIAKELVALRDSLQNNPKSQTLIDKSQRLIEEQREFFSKAEADFKKVLELASDDSEAMRFLGYCLLNQGKTDDAIGVLETLVQKEPDNKEAWGHLSILYTKKGLAEKAKEAEKKAQE
ncbi:MAG: tetratricopeptide repeat protein, partial [Candidatus Zixiibacteriota bacterium]